MKLFAIFVSVFLNLSLAKADIMPGLCLGIKYGRYICQFQLTNNLTHQTQSGSYGATITLILPDSFQRYTYLSISAQSSGGQNHSASYNCAYGDSNYTNFTAHLESSPDRMHGVFNTIEKSNDLDQAPIKMYGDYQVVRISQRSFNYVMNDKIWGEQEKLSSDTTLYATCDHQ